MSVTHSERSHHGHDHGHDHDHVHGPACAHDHAHDHQHATPPSHSHAPRPTYPSASRFMWQIGIVFAAVLIVIAGGALIGVLIGSPAPTPAPKSPFSMGLREGGAATNALAAWILNVQADFSRVMNAAVRAFKTDGYAGFTLAAVAFAYGVFHAAGPGHGKAIVAAYAVATEKQIKGGIGLALGAALLQAAVAIAIVGIFAIVFGATARTMTQAANWVEIASFALVALVGGWLLWVKSGALAHVIIGRTPHHHHEHKHHHHHHAFDDPCGCGHEHAPLPPSKSDWKSLLATIVAAGIRPCSGAIVVLVFALSQGVFWLGIVATFAMALGTFLTTAAIAVLTILAKNRARAFAGGEDSRKGQIVSTGFETLAAAAVLCLGLVLMAGVAGH